MEVYASRNSELLEQYKNGDTAARDKLCAENMGLVRKIAMRFAKTPDMGEDLIQTGTIGLLKAIDNFNNDFNVRFSTYAVPMILGEIKRFLRDDGIIKVSRSLKQAASKGFAAREALIKKLGREPTISEISNECGVSAEELTCAFDAVREPESINKRLYEDSEGELEDRIGIDDEEEKITDRILLDGILKNLPPREKQILVLRYFKDKTQQEIAEIMGVSQVQVSRLEKKVLKEIRERELNL